MKSLVISDIHANLAGLDAVLEAERNWDEIIFLGDAIVAGPQPDQVIRRLAPLNGVWTAGNHDLEPFSRVFTDHDTDPDQIYMRWTRDQISPEGRRFLDRLEPTHVIERDGRVIRLHHGHFPRPLGRPARPVRSGLLWRALRKIRRKLVGPDWDSRIWPDTSPRIFRAIAQEFPEPYVFLAHSHVQFRVQIDGTTFINPGSVGQPRLGQPLATAARLHLASARRTLKTGRPPTPRSAATHAGDDGGPARHTLRGRGDRSSRETCSRMFDLTIRNVAIRAQRKRASNSEPHDRVHPSLLKLAESIPFSYLSLTT